MRILMHVFWHPVATILAPGRSLVVCLLILGCSGCSIRKLALNKVSDALAQTGSTFSADDDPELIRQAVPFSLKLMESLLAENPRHAGLLLASCRSFTEYAYAFVQLNAEELETKDFTAGQEERKRAKRLYLRARNYGLRGLELRHPGFSTAMRKDPRAAAQTLSNRELPTLYWTTLAWAAAIAQAKDEPDMVADLPIVEAFVDRALVLGPGFENGSLHSFMINFEFVRRYTPGDPFPRAKQHFDAAMRLTGGLSVAPLVNYAEAVSVPKQNLAEFKRLLEQALAVDPDKRPEWRLENLVLQRRARWLLDRTDELFLAPSPSK